MALRRQFDLLPADQQFLDDYVLPWETIIDGTQQWVLIHEFPTDERYNHLRVTAAIRMETGYPNTALDMVYFFPPLERRDSCVIGATNAAQALDGKNYQRWSRHRTGKNPWKIGLDSIATHIFLIEDWLAREFEK